MQFVSSHAEDSLPHLAVGRLIYHVADINTVKADIVREHFHADLIVSHDVVLPDLTKVTELCHAVERLEQFFLR